MPKGGYCLGGSSVCVSDCSGALEALAVSLEEFDPGVKEAAAWALGYIARHNAGNPSLYCLLHEER